MMLTLETARLMLRDMSLDDVDALTEVLGDAHSMRYYARPFTRHEVTAWIGRQMSSYEDRGHGLWAVVLKSTGALIGDCGATVQFPIGVEEIELGWHIHSQHQNEGYATEAGAAARDWSFEHLDVPRLVSMIRPENEPSWRVAHKLGMTPRQRFMRAGLRHELWVIDRRAP